MSSGLAGVALVGFVAVSLLAARAGFDLYRRSRARARWESDCVAGGLTLEEPVNGGFPAAAGQIDGVSLRAWVDELRTGGITQQFVRVRADVVGIPEVFIRRRAPEFERSTWPEIMTGDPAFDDDVRVSGPSRPAVREWLSPSRRQTVRELCAVYNTWSIGGGALGLSQRGLTTSTEAWTEQLKHLARVATELSRA